MIDFGRTPEDALKEISTDSRNKFLTKAFLVAAGGGLLVASLNTPIRMGQAIDLGMWSDFVKNTGPGDVLRYVSNHVKGGGQAIAYTQIFNMFLSQVLKEHKERKIKKEVGRHVTHPGNDYSITAGISCLATGFLWEKMTQFQNVGGKFDTEDMIWYGIGVGLTIAWNKLAVKIADKRFPEAAVKSVLKNRAASVEKKELDKPLINPRTV